MELGLIKLFRSAHLGLVLDIAEVVRDAVDDDEFNAAALLDEVALETAHGPQQLLQRLQEKYMFRVRRRVAVEKLKTLKDTRRFIRTTNSNLLC